MNPETNRRIEYGDFQTPDALAIQVCTRLAADGVSPDVVIEPTCGLGAFVIAAASKFPDAAHICGYEINPEYLQILRERISNIKEPTKYSVRQANFFTHGWQSDLDQLTGSILVVGNFPWVTNAAQGLIGGNNLPEKSNFLNFSGFDAISGKANFDISEWMLIDVLRWLKGRHAHIAMLVKTAVARKVMAHAQRRQDSVSDAYIIQIDAKKNFAASVDACLLVINLDPEKDTCYDYTVYQDFNDKIGRRVGTRLGMVVRDLEAFNRHLDWLGTSDQKWRSGIKHDASSVMEFIRSGGRYKNGLGEEVSLEDRFLFPLLKGSDVGSDKTWREKYVLVTQRHVGEQTNSIETQAPLTWSYLIKHANYLDGRGSTIYKKNPRFSIFGIGDYSFRPWRIAICALYKSLRFRLVGPIDGRPVMFDDTVYYVSFETEAEAVAAYSSLNSKPINALLESLIFWDEKRPIKTSILNSVRWSPSTSVEPLLKLTRSSAAE
ncbi:SAM-dependent methyltransferase [Ferrovibrio terrae]|uniref:site-specific DNA-methyltransferase (adenine-specific) n=1 Tax=Ferrovibrio terrae TaxID=2594003 RepID=A0A516H6A7_9PROT|nr:SAM-dependent methyltransferase [Ferrovibrio terrae]QDO99282.1 SAM-dependent methyltransferase [Ferrovibrio terrae]